MVSQYWDPDNVKSHSSALTSHECFSSWHKRNDISGQSDPTSAEKLRSGFENDKAIDGYYCLKNSKWAYHSTESNGGGWLQLNLKGYFSLKCIRIPVRNDGTSKSGHMQEVEVRFGNNSRADNFEKNPIIIAKTASGLEGTIFEYCLDRPLVGKYLLLQEKKSEDDILVVGEIQVLVE